jgi:hypothetical protein
MPLFASSRYMSAGGALVALAVLVGSVPARADEPTPATIEMAGKILDQVGLKATVDGVVPSLLGEIERNLLAAHPEMRDALHATLLSLVPELIKSEEAVLNDVSRVMAANMGEADLKASLAFFQSDAGKKYIMVQKPVLQELQLSGAAWREQMASSLLPKIREEMKKKGFSF